MKELKTGSYLPISLYALFFGDFLTLFIIYSHNIYTLHITLVPHLYSFHEHLHLQFHKIYMFYMSTFKHEIKILPDHIFT